MTTLATALPPWFAVGIAAVLGLVIGSFLNVVVHRVPAGLSLLPASACPRCQAPIRSWQNIPVISWLALRGRCATCHEPISARYPLVELGTGLAFVAVLWWLRTHVEGPLAADLLIAAACLWFAAISIALALIDLDTFRLPNAIVLPSYVVIGVLLGAAAVVSGDWGALVRSLIGLASLWLFYFAVMVIRPDGMGAGDVKLAGVVGMVLAWFGWATFVVGAIAAFFVGAVFGLAVIALRRGGRRTEIPFGPWMLIGAWIGLFAGPAVATTYLNISGLR